MRNAFIQTLMEQARADTNIFLMTGDLGFSVLEPFQKQFPDRFINVGVAEQNLIGIGAGLSLSGKNVFVYSIIPFLTMRCLEQIRNDICMQNLNMKIIGVGAGLHYGAAGSTHHGIEDVGVMRSLPNMTVVSPTTPNMTQQAVELAVKHQGPIYIRLSKSDGEYEGPAPRFHLGKGSVVKEGEDVTIITTGGISLKAAEVAREVEGSGVSVRLIDCSTIKPIDKDIISKAARETKMIFTIEEYPISGGIGTAVAEVLAEGEECVKFKRIGLPNAFVKEVGSREYLQEHNGLSVREMVTQVLNGIK